MTDQVNEEQNTEDNTEQNSQDTTPAPTPSEPEGNKFEDLLASIKVDGRQKYSSVEDALKSLPHANDHISKLEEELASMKAELEKRKSVEEVLAELEERRKTETNSTDQSDSKLDPESIQALVNEQLTAAREQERAQSNMTTVIDALKKEYGDQAEKKFYEIGEANGLSKDFLHQMAQTSPQAVIALAGVGGGSAAPAKTQGNVNTETLKPQPEEKSAKISANPTDKDLLRAWRNSLPDA